MGEYIFQVFDFKKGRHTEHVVSIETTVRAQHMEVGMPTKEVTERMYGDSGPWNLVLSGTASRKNPFKVSHPQRLSSERSFLS